VCLAGASANARSAPAKVTSVRFWSLGDVTRVAIEVSSDFHYKSDRLSNPERLFFDIKGAKPSMLEKGMHVIAVGDGLLKQIRVAETQPGVTRIVLDLEQHAEVTASQLSKPDRLMIELRLKDRPAPPSATSVTGAKRLTDPPLNTVAPDLLASPAIATPPENTVLARSPASKPERRKFEPPPVRPVESHPDPPPEILPQPPLTIANRAPKALPSFDSLMTTRGSISARNATPQPLFAPILPPPPGIDPAPELVSAKTTALPAKSTEPATVALPAKSNSNGGRSLTRVLGLKLGRVVLDPGHGGHDVGTHGPSGLLEKEVVLDVARRLGKLLEDRLGSEVIYTRADDTFIPLEQRTQFANDHKADLFLSIHANSSPYRTAAGVETYYLNFTTSKLALEVATRENASSQRSVFELKDLLQKIALKDKIDESREFATRIETSLYGLSAKSNATAKNRGVKKAPFVVLIGAQMPSVLAEIGFLTNSGDEALLKKPEHRQKIAEALYKGIASYADTLSHFQVAKRE
jgi:N-acetylmuramoyl-L-alanine amidase